MPKLKSNSAAKKRFKLTKNGKIKYSHVGKRHLLTGKSTKRKRGMRKAGYADCANVAQVKRLLPYA